MYRVALQLHAGPYLLGHKLSLCEAPKSNCHSRPSKLQTQRELLSGSSRPMPSARPCSSSRRATIVHSHGRMDVGVGMWSGPVGPATFDEVIAVLPVLLDPGTSPAPGHDVDPFAVVRERQDESSSPSGSSTNWLALASTAAGGRARWLDERRGVMSSSSVRAPPLSARCRGAQRYCADPLRGGCCSDASCQPGSAAKCPSCSLVA